MRAGQLSYAAIERATDACGHRVPRSTTHLILSGKILPRREQLAALLEAFDVTGDVAAEWHLVLERIEHRAQPPAPPARGSYVCVDGDPTVQEYLERRARDEEIKRRAGLIRPDEDYEDYEERVRYQQFADDSLYEAYGEPEYESRGGTKR